MTEPAPDSAPPAPAPVPLIAPFALVGLVGGGLLGAMWLPDGDLGGLAALLPICTPVSAGLLGWWLGARVAEDTARAVTGVMLGTAVAGMINGVFVGMPLLPVNLIAGPIMGLFCAIPFLLPLGLVVAFARRAQGAREGSILRRSRWRLAHLVAAASAVFGAPLAADMVMRDDGRWPMLFVWIALAGAAMATPLLALDLVTLGKTLLLARGGARSVPLGADGVERLARDPVPTVDFGVGEEFAAMVAGVPTAYRDGARPQRVVRGDGRRTSAELALACALHAAVVVAGLGFALHGIASRAALPPGDGWGGEAPPLEQAF